MNLATSPARRVSRRTTRDEVARVASHRALENGLTAAEAARRRAAGQGNAFEPPASRSYLAILRQNAYPAINGPLLGISALLVAFGMVVEAAVTACPVLFNVTVGVVEEARAKRSLDRIALERRPRTAVVRDRREQIVDQADVVLGDVVVARRGDRVVVDGTLLSDQPLEIDEAILTGESEAVAKRPGDALFAGTSVLGGAGRYLATHVGADTAANRMIAAARTAPEERTPLQHEVGAAIWAVAAMVVVVSLLVALTLPRLPGARGAPELLQAAAVLVTLVPQGLAIMLTVTYALGAVRISRLGALVQRLRAIEAMSRVDTLCIDKTGTLTSQRMTFAGVVPIATDGMTPPSEESIRAQLGAMAASTAAPNRSLEAIAAALPTKGRPVADEVPFSSDRAWSAIRFLPSPSSGRGSPGEADWLILGAATAVVPHFDPSSTSGSSLVQRIERTARQGVRVLVLAHGSGDRPLRGADGTAALPSGLRPLALVTLSEELRPDARATLHALADRGIEVKVISGDDPVTVSAVVRALGLPAGLAPVSGPALESVLDADLPRLADQGAVFGRVGPVLKGRLVTALRQAGRYVAMVGDGVNDVLPLRRANLSIAMESGAAATRAAADMVLLGDAFGVLPKAVVEGQRIVAAMQATLVILLARTFSVLLIIVGAVLLGLPFPLTPRQNSVLAFFTVGLPLIVLALWVAPRRSAPSLIRETLRISIPVSVAMAGLALPIYAIQLDGGAVGQARTALTTATILFGLGLLPLMEPPLGQPGSSSVEQWRPWIVALSATMLYWLGLQVPDLRAFFELEPVTPELFGGLLALAVVWTAVVHGARWLVHARRTGAPT